jgi:hypothetical protein
MKKLTYKRHKLEQSDVVPCPQREVPIWIDKHSELRKNGFDPEKDRAGMFSESWRGHPKFALVIAHSFDFPIGEEFVVSNESVYSVAPEKQSS